MKTLLIILGLLALAPANVAADSSNKAVRKAIQTMFGASLPNRAVRVQQVRSGAENVVEVSAEIEAVFRAKATDGRWRLSEVRTGQDTWERLDLIAQALGVQLPTGSCDAASQYVRDPSASAMTAKRARCLVAELLGVSLP